MQRLKRRPAGFLLFFVLVSGVCLQLSSSGHRYIRIFGARHRQYHLLVRSLVNLRMFGINKSVASSGSRPVPARDVGAARARAGRPPSLLAGGGGALGRFDAPRGLEGKEETSREGESSGECCWGRARPRCPTGTRCRSGTAAVRPRWRRRRRPSRS